MVSAIVLACSIDSSISAENAASWAVKHEIRTSPWTGYIIRSNIAPSDLQNAYKGFETGRVARAKGPEIPYTYKM